MRPIRLAFAEITLRHLPDEIPGQDFVEEALTSAEFEGLEDPSSSMSGFVNTHRQELLGQDCVVGFFAYASGNQHQSIDAESHELEDVPFQKPPLQGKSMFVISPRGRVVLENKATSALEARKVLSRIEDELRRYGALEVIPKNRATRFPKL